MNSVLIVEDEKAIADLIEMTLEPFAYGCTKAYDGETAADWIEKKSFDLILLDVMLPGVDGFTLMDYIAPTGTPVIFLTARASVEDRVRGLRAGAYDYIVKPFAPEELLARVAVQLRRGKPVPAAGLLQFQEIELDTGKRSVRVSGVSVKLTKTEYAVLKLLMRNPSQVMTRSVLLDEISGDSPDGVESSLKVHVSNLRRKLREAGGKDYIESVWGIPPMRGSGNCWIWSD